MYKQIVVGTDGSETASGAVTQAIRLAEMTGATVHVVCAYNMPAPMGAAVLAAETMAYAPTTAELKARADEVLERAGEQLRRAGVKAETYACPGNASEAIIHVAETQKADVIVVGSRGMTGARRLLGSVPNSIAHHAPCSVLIAQTT